MDKKLNDTRPLNSKVYGERTKSEYYKEMIRLSQEYYQKAVSYAVYGKTA